ncbi:MAG: hypothetical protein HOE90_06420 [Bacteriovoracaceae bacterium]|nr:hypothetical protein [Bacteriovoracaceae bacterium]
MITAHALNSSSRVRHGFFTRQGGVSQGLYGSLNCGFGSGDNPDHVAANRANAQARLAGDKTGDSELVSVYQVHSPTVVHVNEPWAPGDAPQADAMVTARPGVALGVLTADCAPVLFADANANAPDANANETYANAYADETDANAYTPDANADETYANAHASDANDRNE